MNRTALPANPRPLTGTPAGTFGIAAAAPPRAVIYLRVSTQAQAEDGTSLDTQRADCLTQARRMNAQVVGVFSDEGVTGGSYQTRDGLQAALREIEAGRANRLVAFKLDRTGRDVSIILDIYKRVIQAGGVLVLSDGMTFADNPNDRLMLTVLGGVAEQEKSVIRDRTCKGRRARAEEGQQVSRSLRPYGFIIVTKAMVLTGQAKPEELGKYLQHPDEAPWVRFMFEQYAGGASLRQVALSLHGMGVPTARGGKEWEPKTIAGILRNPAHKGAATFGRERRVFDETRWMNGLKTSHYNGGGASVG